MSTVPFQNTDSPRGIHHKVIALYTDRLRDIALASGTGREDAGSWHNTDFQWKVQWIGKFPENIQGICVICEIWIDICTNSLGKFSKLTI